MKTTTKTVLATLALGLSALAASAQNDDQPPMDGNGPGPRGHRPPPLPVVQALDVNHDRVIDAGEMANASAALLTLDKNNDGVLTTNEYLPPLPKDAPADAPRPPLPPIIKALDVNGDGTIDTSEIANAPAELQTLDKNNDGQLTRDEFCPRPPRRPHNFGGDNRNAPGQDNGQNAPDDAPPGPPPND